MSVDVFETIRIRAGRAPLLPRHAARLAASCAALGLPLVDRPLADLVAPACAVGEGVIRVAVGERGIALTTRAVPPPVPLDLVIATVPHVPYPHKVTMRTVFDTAQAEARAVGADDALLLTMGGLVAEGTAWTIFWWDGDRLATPSLSLGVLPGVARGRVMELAPTSPRECAPAELTGHSLFATNAVRGIVPIARLNGVPVRHDARTTRLADRFWE